MTWSRQYVNPETTKETLPEISEPLEPKLSSYKPDVIPLANLEREDRETYRWDYDRYERRLLEYQKRIQALADFNLEISKTVSKKQLYLTQNCNTPHDRLFSRIRN